MTTPKMVFEYGTEEQRKKYLQAILDRRILDLEDGSVLIYRFNKNGE